VVLAAMVCRPFDAADLSNQSPLADTAAFRGFDPIRTLTEPGSPFTGLVILPAIVI